MQTFGCSAMKDTSSEFTNDSDEQCSHHTAPIAPSTHINLRTTGRPSSNNQVNQQQKSSTASEDTNPEEQQTHRWTSMDRRNMVQNPSRVHQQSIKTKPATAKMIEAEHAFTTPNKHDPRASYTPQAAMKANIDTQAPTHESNRQDTATSQIHHKWKEHQITGSGKEDCGKRAHIIPRKQSTDQRQQMEDHHPMT